MQHVKKNCTYETENTQQGDLLSSVILVWFSLPIFNGEEISVNKEVEIKCRITSLEFKEFTHVLLVLLMHIYPAYSRFHTWYNCIMSIQDRLNKQQNHI